MGEDRIGGSEICFELECLLALRSRIIKSSADKQDFRSGGANDWRQRFVFLGGRDFLERLVVSSQLRQLQRVPMMGGALLGFSSIAFL